MFEAFQVALASVWMDSGFVGFQIGQGIMIIVGLVLLYMAIIKGFEPLLLSPIAFGCILANIPANEAMLVEPGVMKLILAGIHYEVFPPLIFLGIGAMTDFGPLISNPSTLRLGAIAVGVLGVIPMNQVFSGLSNSTVVLFAAMFVIGAAMFQTGLAQKIGTTVVKFTGTGENSLMAGTMAVAAVLSAFPSNTATTACLIPVVAGICAASRIPVNRQMMPLAFGADRNRYCQRFGRQPPCSADGHCYCGLLRFCDAGWNAAQYIGARSRRL